MPKKSYTHMSFEERETLSLGLSQGQSLRTMAAGLGRAQQHEPRVCPQCHPGAPLSCLYGAQPGRGPESSPTAIAQTAGSLVVALCPNRFDPWVFA